MNSKFIKIKKKQLSDIRNLLKDAEALYESIVDDSTEKSKQIKKSLGVKIKKLKQEFNNIEEELTDLVKTTVKDTDAWVRKNSYSVLGAAFSIGMIIAFIKKDKSSR